MPIPAKLTGSDQEIPAWTERNQLLTKSTIEDQISWMGGTTAGATSIGLDRLSAAATARPSMTAGQCNLYLIIL
jgi:hypothetical protein